MVAPAGRALFFHAEPAPSAEADVEAKRCNDPIRQPDIQLQQENAWA